MDHRRIWSSRRVEPQVSAQLLVVCSAGFCSLPSQASVAPVQDCAKVHPVLLRGVHSYLSGRISALPESGGMESVLALTREMLAVRTFHERFEEVFAAVKHWVIGHSHARWQNGCAT